MRQDAVSRALDKIEQAQFDAEYELPYVTQLCAALRRALATGELRQAARDDIAKSLEAL